MHVCMRAHDAAAGVAIRTQHEMAHFVGDDVAERDREIRGGAGHRPDALAVGLDAGREDSGVDGSLLQAQA